MAEDEGFEPPQTESESGVLPLHKSSNCNVLIICNYFQKSRTFLFFSKIKLEKIEMITKDKKDSGSVFLFREVAF